MDIRPDVAIRQIVGFSGIVARVDIIAAVASKAAKRQVSCRE
jgi:hypothetical protein